MDVIEVESVCMFVAWVAMLLYSLYITVVPVRPRNWA